MNGTGEWGLGNGELRMVNETGECGMVNGTGEWGLRNWD